MSEIRFVSGEQVMKHYVPGYCGTCGAPHQKFEASCACACHTELSRAAPDTNEGERT